MDILFITHFLNGFLMIAMPIGLGIYLTHRFHLGWRIWLIGAAGFLLSQVGHIPFNWGVNQIFVKGLLPLPSGIGLVVFNALFGGLSAGLWEELTRYSVFRWWAKDARSWGKGLLAGAGHGGAEAIVLGGLVMVNFFALAAYRYKDMSTVVSPDQLAQAQQQITSFWSIPWPMSLLGAVERLFTIPCQIALAVLVLQAFTRKKFYWVGLAVLYHAILDASTVYLSSLWNAYSWGVYAIEGVIGIFALISIAIIFLLRDRAVPQSDLTGPEMAPAEIAPQEPARVILPEKPLSEVKPTDLNDSRFM
jgi:uncharacterized membrane protein YhfC